MNAAAKIKAIAPWFGGKRTMAPLIVTELGQHGQYFEPFCGSMAVLFAKPPSQKETVNDLHGDIINLARVIQDVKAGPILYERLQSVLFSEDLLSLACDHLDDESSLSLIVSRSEPFTDWAIERAYWYFLASWMMRNGIAGTARMEYQVAVRWTKSGGSPTIRWRNAVDSIPAWHQRLRNVVILRRDAFGIMNRFEDVKETAIYVDPPYMPSTRNGYGNHGNGSKYKHELDHDNPLFGDDHKRLAAMLAKYRQARIVVSYYDCERIRELYKDWTFVKCSRQKQLHAMNGRGAKPVMAPEVLIINGPSYAVAT